MNSRWEGAASDIHKWPHPPKSRDKAYSRPVSLYLTLLDLHKRRGLPRAWPPPPFASVGEGLSRNTPIGAQLALIFSPSSILTNSAIIFVIALLL